MGDEGHLQVLEAMMVSLILLGAAYTVLAYKLPTSDKDRTRTDLERLLKDSMTVLAGLRGARGTELDANVEDALQGNVSNLTLKLGSYLPLGTAYAVLLDNGLEKRELYRMATPAGEAVSATVGFSPSWNTTFVATELSCYESGMDVNATMLPVFHGMVQGATAAQATSAGATRTAVRSLATTSAWNVTFPAIIAAGTIAPAVTAKHGTLPGAAGYGLCALGGKGPAIVTALRSAKLTPAGPGPAGGTLAFSTDLTALRAVAGVTVTSASISVFDPLPPGRNVPDNYTIATNLTLAVANTPSVTWNVPAATLYGSHPTLLRVNLTVGSTSVQARVVGVANVALANGVVPLDPPYRLSAQAWFRDWR